MDLLRFSVHHPIPVCLRIELHSQPYGTLHAQWSPLNLNQLHHSTEGKIRLDLMNEKEKRIKYEHLFDSFSIDGVAMLFIPERRK